MKIQALVVVYNTRLENSKTLRSILSQVGCDDKSIEITIYDNSSISMFDFSFVDKLKHQFIVKYYHTPENLTLREIYNKEIDILDKADFLILLDDDTSLPNNYFLKMLVAQECHPQIELFVPNIVVKDQIYSPYISYYFVSKPIKNSLKGLCKTKNMSAINSGMMISGAFFNNTGFRYPGYVDFYGTDIVFFDALSSSRDYFCVVDVQVEHEVSNHPSNLDVYNYAGILNKVNFFWIKHLRKKWMLLIAYRIFMILYALKLSIKTKNVIFLKNVIKLSVK